MPRARGKDCRKGCIGGPDPYQEHKLLTSCTVRAWWTLCEPLLSAFTTRPRRTVG